jgi:hypothetical protein
MSTHAGFHAQLAMVPRRVERAHIESVVQRFMSTYPVKDVDTRVALFADVLRFDDPAGLQFASNRASSGASSRTRSRGAIRSASSPSG